MLPESETVFKPLSQLEEILSRTSPGDMLLYMIAVKTTADEIKQAIETLLATAWVDLTPQEINDGDCAEFADNVASLLDRAVAPEWMMLPDGTQVPHCAIPFDGKWYDSEAPNGALLEEHPFVVRFLKEHKLFVGLTSKYKKETTCPNQ